MGKFLFDSIAIAKQCYHLAAMAIASRQIREVFIPPTDADIHLFYAYEDQEIHQALIYVAIQLRMIDDILIQNNRNREFVETEIGFLNETDILTLRDACNKIIHAEEIEVGLPSSPEIILHGSKSGDPWKAKFAILDFVKSTMRLVDAYDEDWEIQ